MRRYLVLPAGKLGIHMSYHRTVHLQIQDQQMSFGSSIAKKTWTSWWMRRMQGLPLWLRLFLHHQRNMWADHCVSYLTHLSLSNSKKKGYNVYDASTFSSCGLPQLHTNPGYFTNFTVYLWSNLGSCAACLIIQPDQQQCGLQSDRMWPKTPPDYENSEADLTFSENGQVYIPLHVFLYMRIITYIYIYI